MSEANEILAAIAQSGFRVGSFRFFDDANTYCELEAECSKTGVTLTVKGTGELDTARLLAKKVEEHRIIRLRDDPPPQQPDPPT